MAGRSVAVVNMKGGVGKTTTVVTLAETLLAEDPSRRVLVVDLDPQASASFMLAGDLRLGDMIASGRTFQDYLELRILEGDGTPLPAFVHSGFGRTTHGAATLDVHLLPCGPRLRNVEKRIMYEMVERHRGFGVYEARLAKLHDADFATLAESYDYVVYDCPPGISPFVELVVRRADMVLMPTIPNLISTMGLVAFVESVWKASGGARAPRAHVLFTRVERNGTHDRIVAEVAEAALEPARRIAVLATRIPQLKAVVDAVEGDHAAESTYTRRYADGFRTLMGKLSREVRVVVDGR